MLRSNSRSLGYRVVSPEEEKERLQWEGFAGKEAEITRCQLTATRTGLYTVQTALVMHEHSTASVLRCQVQPTHVIFAYLSSSCKLRYL